MVAQLGERRVRNAEVGSSILLHSTISQSGKGCKARRSLAFQLFVLFPAVRRSLSPARQKWGAISPLFFVRPDELRNAKWKEFDLDKREWVYLVTKTKTDHLVHLASQAVSILRQPHALTEYLEHLFPVCDPLKSMSGAAMNATLRCMGYDTKTEITGHGFRAMARTILHQEIANPPEVIGHQLAHRVQDSLGMAYNRTKFIKERRKMMQQWVD